MAHTESRGALVGGDDGVERRSQPGERSRGATRMVTASFARPRRGSSGTRSAGGPAVQGGGVQQAAGGRHGLGPPEVGVLHP